MGIAAERLYEDEIPEVAQQVQSNLTIDQQKKVSFHALCEDKNIKIVYEYINESIPVKTIVVI
jgi:hypothetical protein